MAAFVGPDSDRREYEVVFPEDQFLAGSKLSHVRELDGSQTLCGHACDYMDGWEVRRDWHPEDVDQDERCQRCYATIEARRRRARGEALPKRPRRRMTPIAGASPKPSAKDVARLVARRDETLERANREIGDAVRVAQDAGVPMRALADAMGMTRQGVYVFLGRVG